MKHLAEAIHPLLTEALKSPDDRPFLFPFGIESIHLVPCRAFLVVHRDWRAALNITRRNVYYHNEAVYPVDNLYYYQKEIPVAPVVPVGTPQWIEALLLESKAILSDLRFNRLEGQFQPSAEPIANTLAFECENVRMECRPCRICGEATKTKATCSCPRKHLCFACWEQIEAVLDEEFGEVRIQHCPECRQVLVFEDTRSAR